MERDEEGETKARKLASRRGREMEDERQVAERD